MARPRQQEGRLRTAEFRIEEVFRPSPAARRVIPLVVRLPPGVLRSRQAGAAEMKPSRAGTLTNCTEVLPPGEEWSQDSAALVLEESAVKAAEQARVATLPEERRVAAVEVRSAVIETRIAVRRNTASALRSVKFAFPSKAYVTGIAIARVARSAMAIAGPRRGAANNAAHWRAAAAATMAHC